MTDAPLSALHLRVTLDHVAPAVWREIAVPESFTFLALHCAIQDAMGWRDCRLEPPLRAAVERSLEQHARDLERGAGWVEVPGALARK